MQKKKIRERVKYQEIETQTEEDENTNKYKKDKMMKNLKQNYFK